MSKLTRGGETGRAREVLEMLRGQEEARRQGQTGHGSFTGWKLPETNGTGRDDGSDGTLQAKASAVAPCPREGDPFWGVGSTGVATLSRNGRWLLGTTADPVRN